MFKYLLIGLGGFIGATARYAVSGWISQIFEKPFPYGTLTVNVVGCALAGLLMFATEEKLLLSVNLRLFLGIGILGGFTTFSTFGYETIELIKDQQLLYALLYVLANVILGLLAVWLIYIILRSLN